MEVSDNLPRFKALIKEPQIPVVDIGPHCSDPFGCEFMAHCWQHVPYPSVFNLRRIGAKAFPLYERGKISYEDLAQEASLNEKQSIQVHTYLNQEVIKKSEAIRSFLDSLQFPLYFFDFETINPAIPLYQGTKPYEQVGVQYSLHVLERPEAELKHFEHLSEFEGDPRPALIRQLLTDLGTAGNIVAYNMSFEQRVIKSLAEAFPEYRAPLEALIDRFVDLIVPFRNFDYYHYEMQGSASIKAVLPALFPNDPDLSYQSLSVSDGGAASTLLQAMAEGTLDPEVYEQVRKDLLAYCKLDTLAMVKIWEKLREVSND